MPYTVTTALWEGTTGLPGYTKMKWNSALPSQDCVLAANKQKAFFTAVASLLPTDVSISWDGIAQQFDDQGTLTGEVSYTPPTSLAGTSGAAYASPVGMIVDWLTGDFINGRRLRGRTFLVPLTSAAFTGDGTPVAGAITQLTNAAGPVIAGDPLLVVNGGGTWDAALKKYVNKTTRVISGAAVPDRACVLRSRRD